MQHLNQAAMRDNDTKRNLHFILGDAAAIAAFALLFVTSVAYVLMGGSLAG
jgi:hypothetical protein